jgi:hypothetical protein
MAVDVQIKSGHTDLCKVCCYGKKGYVMKNDMTYDFEVRMMFLLAVTRVILVTGKAEHGS